MITIPNDRLRGLATKSATMIEMFKKADEILLHSVKGITDLIMMPGLVNLDFAEAVGRLNLQLAGLQAAQQTFARVQNLTLFNFI